MEADDVLEKLRGYMTLDQEFHHYDFMSRLKQIEDKDDLIQILDLSHSNYLIRTKLFTNLAQRLVRDGYELPSLADLLVNKKEPF